MKHFTTITLIAACAATVSAGAMAHRPSSDGIDLTRFSYRTESKGAFAGQRFSQIERANRLLACEKSAFRAPAAEVDPAFTLGPSSMTGDMDAPDGERWMYTASYEYKIIPPDYDNGISYTDYIVTHYHFDIYDAGCNHVGTIDAPMDYAEDEYRLANIELAPVVTRNFFNTDDNVEIMVGLGINTIQPGMNRYRTLVYSLPSDASAVVDKPTRVIDSLLSDAIEGERTADGKDNFYMIFGDDYMPEDLIDDEDATYWEYITAAKIQLNFYAPAHDNENGPVLIASKPMPLLQLPGDQESTPFILSHLHDGQVRYMFSYLEEPFWEEYDDPIFSDMVQRDSNKLIVEFYTASADGLKLDHTTKIDVVRDEEDYSAIASFYGIGDMNYRDDLLYNFPGAKDGKPYLVVTRNNYNPSSDNSNQSYFIYDPDGKPVHTLALYCDSSVGLTDIPGHEPQQMFIGMNGGEYLFSFVDLYSGKVLFSTSNHIEVSGSSELEQVTANVDRTPVGDSYQYVFELLSPDVDAAGNTLVRTLWLKSNGDFDRIESVNTGADVLYAQMYINGEALKPDTFHSDADHEYMALVKRGVPGEVLTEELMICQPVSDEKPEGKTLLHLTPCEKGNLASIVPYLGGSDNSLTVYYHNEDSTDKEVYIQDIYTLPLDGGAGVNMVENSVPEFVVNGSTLIAEGEITVFSTTGVKVTEGVGSVELRGLPAGIYVVVTSGGASKLYVK